MLSTKFHDYRTMPSMSSQSTSLALRTTPSVYQASHITRVRNQFISVPPSSSPPSSPSPPPRSTSAGGSGGDVSTRWTVQFFNSGGVIAVLVLGSLCLVLGIVYGYIYYTRINPRAHRIRKYTEPTPGQSDDGVNLSTHLFLFKKP